MDRCDKANDSQTKDEVPELQVHTACCPDHLPRITKKISLIQPTSMHHSSVWGSSCESLFPEFLEAMKY
jgi:hypothetical protein